MTSLLHHAADVILLEKDLDVLAGTSAGAATRRRRRFDGHHHLRRRAAYFVSTSSQLPFHDQWNGQD